MWPPGKPTQPVGLGAMRLSTELARDEASAVASLHAALDAGVDLIDTANAYALDASEVGHNERLIARALDSWTGDRRQVTVITKGGLTRPDGRWVPDGRAKALTAACHASCAALGVPRLPLYQLHAPDPHVPLATSVRALATLRHAGVIEAVGLCNVNVGQIEAARRIVDIAAVQIELSPWNDRPIANGVVAYCIDHGIRVLAYRPFGGVKAKRRVLSDPLLVRIAAAHDASPFEVVLSWMRGLSPHIVPLPGATRVDTARSCGRAVVVVLSDSEQVALGRRFALGALQDRASGQRRTRVSSPADGEDIVMVMGLPGAGKSTYAARLVAEGYERLNRDQTGGTLRDLAQSLATRLERGARRVVLDNTYLSRASRAGVIAAAAARGRGVRGLWLDTTLEDAQLNAVWRMVRAHGRLLTPAELRAGRTPEAMAPSAQFRAQREIEPPQLAEGFAHLEVVPFVRATDPALTHRAIILWCDGVIRRSRSGAARPQAAEDVEAILSYRDQLARFCDEGWRLLGLSWEPEVTERGRTQLDVENGLARLRDRLGLDIEFAYCPHGAGPPVCWCRKPLPGLGVLLIERFQLDARQCIYVGASPQDPVFARRLGFQYRGVHDFPSEPTASASLK